MSVMDNVKKVIQEMIVPELHEIKSKVSTIEVEIRRMDEKIDTGLSRLDEKIDTGISRLNEKIDTGISRLDEKIDTGLSRLDERIDTGISRLDEKITSLRNEFNSRFDAVDYRLTSMGKEISQAIDIHERLAAVEAKLTLH